MKIKINNIFKNFSKNVDIKKEDNDYEIYKKNKRQVKKIENIMDFKKVDSDDNNQISDDIEEIVIENIDDINPRVRRRKNGFIEQEVKKEKENKFKKYLSNLFKNRNNLTKGYYLLFIGMLGLGGGSVYLAAKTYNLFNKEDYTVYDTAESSLEDTQVFNNADNSNNADDIDDLKEQEVQTSNNDTKNVDNNKNTVSNNNQSTTNSNKNIDVPKVEPLVFSKPINGEILKIYSADKLIYSKTLELWKTHEGIDIKASIGDKVKSIEKGIVEKVYEDAFYGVTVVIDHGQGYKSSYSNLDEDVPVKEKESVTKGKVIGKISNTAIGEIKDDPHLHFALIKNNEIVDPSYIFN